MDGGAAEVLLVSLNCPQPLLKTHPPSILVCCFLVFVEMVPISTASQSVQHPDGWRQTQMKRKPKQAVKTMPHNS